MKTASVASYVLRDAAKKAGVSPADLTAMAESAWAELYAHGIVDSAAMERDQEPPAGFTSEAEIFLDQLRNFEDPVINANLAIAEIKADAPRLQSSPETIIWSVAGGAALVVFAVRFGLTTFTYENGKLTLKVSASDSEHTTGIFNAIGNFLARVLPFVGGGDKLPPDSDA